MKIIKNHKELCAQLERERNSGNKIGFVPTMGTLHEGHLSLIKKAQNENDISVVSIYLNPTQFNNSDDFKNYPRTDEQDQSTLNSLGVSYLYLPQYNEIYSDEFTIQISEIKDSQVLCGKSRPGHFTGVLTVVCKLLNIVKPNKVYFGEKDYQQFVLIKKLVKSLFLTVEVIGCPIIRERGSLLALSSRNLKLNDEELKLAKYFAEVFHTNSNPQVILQKLSESSINIEYLEEHWGRAFIAVNIGGTRLIDNRRSL